MEVDNMLKYRRELKKKIYSIIHLRVSCRWDKENVFNDLEKLFEDKNETNR